MCPLRVSPGTRSLGVLTYQGNVITRILILPSLCLPSRRLTLLIHNDCAPSFYGVLRKSEGGRGAWKPVFSKLQLAFCYC
jgi:hypothetical protein